MDRYASEVIRLGEKLAEGRVPIEEVIASLHLFEESAHSVFPDDPPLPIGSTPLSTSLAMYASS